MEAAGLAIGIAALYTACRECYGFFTTVKTAGADSSFHLRELEIQQSILKAWGFHWQIQESDDAEPERPGSTRKRTKLHEYLLTNRFKAEGVFRTLSSLADTLSNQEKLIKRYGIHLQPVQAIEDGSQITSNVHLTLQNITIEDIKPAVGEIRNRLSVLNKFKWALKDKNNFKNLVSDLKSHSESLYRLCPENAFESMNIYLTLDCLARQESPASLKWTSKLANQQAQNDTASSVREGYELLASAATLKASVNENRNMKNTNDNTLTSIDEETSRTRYLGKGLSIFEDEVVYVEMRDYRGPPLDLTPEQKQKLRRRRRRKRARYPRPWTDNTRMPQSQTETDDSDESNEENQPIELVRPADPQLLALIRNYYNTFEGGNKMKSVCGLDIAGIIDHTEGQHKGHCSILYKLPGTIGVQSRIRPAENLKLRAPVTLESLLQNDDNNAGVRSTLGMRFKLAKKILRAVCLLHSSGWLHKNIRAESVMFFPEHADTFDKDRYDIKIKIDISKPVLMGYIFSRPDNVIMPMKTSSTLYPEPSTESSSGFGDHSTSEFTRTWQNPMDEAAQGKQRNETHRSAGRHGQNIRESGIPAEQTKQANISGFTLDYYQHPAKHADPKRLYRHAYDVYSLGILLIEIGLWEKLKDAIHFDEVVSLDEEDHYDRRRLICLRYLGRLRWFCGDTYADAVLRCIMIDSSDDEVTLASERELCARIVADLEGCQA